MTIKTMAEAEVALRPYVPLVSQLTGQDTTLERIKPLMALLGNPERNLIVLHIAGTSGKTSTAYYAAALLAASGQKVGLTVSPHVDSITERVQINGQPLSESVFCRELGEFLQIVRRADNKPSYFELLYAFAIWIFDKQQVDYAVIETGMGGLFDATNVARQADKVCVITDIGYDHTHILGKTLPEIAAQKIGIAHPGNQVFTYRQTQEVMEVFESYTAKQSAKLNVTTEAQERALLQSSITTMPAYQQRNWLLAYYVYRYLLNRDNLQRLTRQALEETQAIKIPARLEVKRLEGKTIVMDGAHNAQKMTAFSQSFKQLYPDQRPSVLLALKETKDFQEIVPVIADLTDHIILTTFNTTQDLPARSLEPRILATALHKANIRTVEVIKDQREAFKALLATPGETVIITGSFYLLSQIRHNEGLT